jgi:hypothetical protein
MLASGPKRIPRTPLHNVHNSDQRRAGARQLQTERTHLRRIVADADLSVAGLHGEALSRWQVRSWTVAVSLESPLAIHLPYTRQHDRVASTSKTQSCLLWIWILTCSLPIN